MDDEKREAMRWKAVMRPITCVQCGGRTTDLDGSIIRDGFPGIVYQVCGSCGYTRPKAGKLARRMTL